MTLDVGHALAMVKGAAVVVDENGKLLSLHWPQDAKPDDRYVADSLSGAADDIQAWIDDVGISHPDVVVDSQASWDKMLRMARNAKWPKSPGPATTEQALMNWSWITQSLDSENPRLSESYASLIAEVFTGSSPVLGGHHPPDPRVSRAMTQPGMRHLAQLFDTMFDAPKNLISWSRAWAGSGFCKVDVSLKTMSALAFSDAPEDAMSPWRAFSIVVHPGICDPVRRLLCCADENSDGQVALVSAVQENGDTVHTEPRGDMANEWQSEERHRVLLNIARGVAIAISNGAATGPFSGGKSRNFGPPNFERWNLSAPVQIDATQALKEFWINPSGRLIRSQFPVRGHYRNQACGPRLRDRVRKWIHPYWKGDRAAAALVRRVNVRDTSEAAE